MGQSGSPVNRAAYGDLLHISIPITLTQFAGSLLLVTSSMVVTAFAPDQLPILGGGNGIFFFAQFVLVSILFALDGYIAQAAGQDADDALTSVMNTALSFSQTIGFIAVLAAGILWGALAGTKSEAMGEYVFAMALSLPFYMAFLVVQKFWNASGGSRYFLLLGVVSLVVNAVTSLALVHPVRGLGLGANGIAWATLVMRVMVLVLAMHYTFRRLGWQRTQRWFRPGHDRGVFTGILRLSLSTGLNGALDSATFLILSLGAIHFGLEAMAMNQHAMTLGLALFPVYWGISSASTILVGRAIGAGNLASALGIARQAMLLAVLVGFSISGVLALTILANAAHLGPRLTVVLLCVAGYQWADSIQAVASGIVRASNIGTPQIYANAVSFYLLGPVYLVLCLLLGLGFAGVWIAFSMAIVSTGVVHYLLYLRWRTCWVLNSLGGGYA